MAINLLVNVRNALNNGTTPQLYGWIGSMVAALHWIKENGQYKQFVANRVGKSQIHKEIQWRYVPLEEVRWWIQHLGRKNRNGLKRNIHGRRIE